MLEVSAPSIRHIAPARVAQFFEVVALFERAEIEAAVDGLISLLDLRDGDADLEDDEHAASAGPSSAKPPVPLRSSDGLPGDPDDAEDSDEDDDPSDLEEEPDREAGSTIETGEEGSASLTFADDDHEEDRSLIEERSVRAALLHGERCQRLASWDRHRSFLRSFRNTRPCGRRAPMPVQSA